MSSKQEIKNAFEAELRNTPEYQIVLQMKAFILNEITTPHIQEEVAYNFETPLGEAEQKNIKLCMVVEFGFSTDNMSDSCIVIDMKKFLE